MLVRSILVFLICLLGLPAQAQTILVWGDSLSAGYGLTAREAWPTLLQSRLRERGFRHKVVNGSVSGETTAGGRSRLPAALEAHRPEVVIVELGANDGLRGLPAPLMKDNLLAMLEMARGAGARTLLVGMALPPNYGRAYIARFHQSYADVVASARTAFVPFLLDGFASRRELFQADGIHPTAEAQPLILDTVWKGLAPLLK
jgi:acyl-CoA thioesterase-1